LLAFDASQLLDQLGDKIYLSPINSGNARRRPVPRSTLTFVPYCEWVETGWRKLGDENRAPRCPPAEILLEGNLPLKPFLVSACVASKAQSDKPRSRLITIEATILLHGRLQTRLNESTLRSGDAATDYMR
jgi:hypothetical protein